MEAESRRIQEWTRVAVIDDHTLVRQGFVGLIEEIPGYEVVLQASNGKDFIANAEGVPLDLAVVDMDMPVMNGLQTLEWIHARRPEIRSVVLTFDASDDTLTKAIRKGARGYMHKTIDKEELAIALNAIRDKGYYQNNLIEHHWEVNPEELTSEERARQAVLARITPRQLEFLQLIGDARELTYPQIADSMGVHVRTIDNYFQGLRDEFGIRSKTGMLLFAVKWGIVKV